MNIKIGVFKIILDKIKNRLSKNTIRVPRCNNNIIRYARA